MKKKKGFSLNDRRVIHACGSTIEDLQYPVKWHRDGGITVKPKDRTKQWQIDYLDSHIDFLKNFKITAARFPRGGFIVRYNEG